VKIGLNIPTGRAFPHDSEGLGPAELRTFATAAESLGFDYLGLSEHVIGADVRDRPQWNLPWSNRDPNHDALVMFGFIAACTSTVGLKTEILVLPQRQTVIVAKQAAELALLSDNRFVLGVAIGRNFFEYAALGYDFRTRGRRFEEQIGLLRQLWTSRCVVFRGEFEAVDMGGLWPLPSRPIPVWMGGGVRPAYAGGGMSRSALERIGKLGDGWISLNTSGPSQLYRDAVEIIMTAGEDAGRNMSGFGIEGSVNLGPQGSLDKLAEDVAAWHDAGASEVMVYLNSGPQGDAPPANRLIETIEALAGKVVIR